ncbi:hypothetical protein [Streptomyces sp. RFCAC02]|uniref:hypothetical protein n=1 Tax=Streptomyces sp. RFCAC02 TaxID=2499143 RepID=UPI00102153BE|nr:hypothetical protein [Streptomyces sp. RFCAC02]
MGRLLLRWKAAVRDRLQTRHRDSGAGFVEYAGLLLFIVAIVLVVRALPVGSTIGNFIMDRVNAVTGGS